MASDAIDFWFSTGSTYTYLAVSRLPAVAKTAGVRFNWRPFSVRAIMREQNNVPFAGKPVKSAYMWRDIERRAGLHGLPVKVPAPYPLKEFDLANRLAVWVSPKAGASTTSRRATAVGSSTARSPGSSPTCRRASARPVRIRRAAWPARPATMSARWRGIFGSPTFCVGDELFWGDDRLEDALSWFRHGKVMR
jgi:2-hydroxychromene-2-carboxylate isomerase